MTMDDMRYILAIAQQGSITKAAQELFITQPTLSQRLQKVENELATRLFERNRFGEVTPTEAGRIFLTESERILKHWNRIQEDIRALKERQTLTFGIPVRTGYPLVEGVMEYLAESYPGLTITFVDRPIYQMEEMLTRGELDFGLIRMPTPGLNLKMRMLFQNIPTVHLRKGSPLHSQVYYHPGDPQPYIDLKALEDEPLVAAPHAREHRTRLWLETLFSQVPGLHPRVVYTVPNINMYEHYAQNGSASYVLPLPTAKEHVCLLEPEYAMPYATYFAQSNRADPEIADEIFQFLYRQLNKDF